MKRHICNASVNDIFQIQLPPRSFILECHCNTDLLCMYIIHEQALILSFHCNEMEYISGTRLGSVFCSYLEFQPVWHFEHLRCWLFSCSWSNFRCLSLSLLPAETGYIDPVLIEKYNTPGFVGCLSECSSTALLLWKLRSGPVVLHPSHTRVNWWNPTAEHHPSLSHPCLLQLTLGT